MKFKLDENLPADLKTLLQEGGHDVADVLGENLGGKDDAVILNAAAKEQRILLTFDLDFADIRLFPLGTHAGIAVFRVRDQRWATLEAPAKKLLKSRVLSRLSGGLAIVDETRVRFRQPRKK